MEKKSAKSSEVIRISSELKSALDVLEIETGGIKLGTYELKIQHLLWHYKHYKNNNGNS